MGVLQVSAVQLQRLKDGLRYFLEFLNDPNFADDVDMYDGLPVHDVPNMSGMPENQWPMQDRFISRKVWCPLVDIAYFYIWSTCHWGALC
jgi:hypothetical protein